MAIIENEELFDIIDGIHAYDIGFTDSGISDPLKREIISDMLKQEDSMKILSQYVDEYFLSEEAMADGYGLEDVKEFIDWLSINFNYDVAGSRENILYGVGMEI